MVIPSRQKGGTHDSTRRDRPCGSTDDRQRAWVELDPKAVVYTLPDNIKWVVNEVGSGPNFDLAGSTVPLPAGSVVTHYGKQVHYDGAKDEDAVLMIVGDGPATSTPFVTGMELPKK
jgi:hypothetical protein